MAIDVEKLLNWPFEELRHEYSVRDTILYALGLGLGSDPVDEEQLRFVYERDLRALPTMAVVLAYPGFWLREPGAGVNWKKILHGEQGIVWHASALHSAGFPGRDDPHRNVDRWRAGLFSSAARRARRNRARQWACRNPLALDRASPDAQAMVEGIAHQEVRGPKKMTQTSTNP